MAFFNAHMLYCKLLTPTKQSPVNFRLYIAEEIMNDVCQRRLAREM